ncbi:helix-turn-helix domain-containing protein [Enterobacter kobei]|nr:helix-turn-helix domain-containing protein [Enterobacter kobei]
MYKANHNPDSINSLLLCAQAALLDGAVSNRDVANVLDIAQDLVSVSVNDLSGGGPVPHHQAKKQPTPNGVPHDSVNLVLGDRIKIARENLGLSEADLARNLNNYSYHISDWECGITEPPVSMIIPLANALKCDPLWLLTGNNEIADKS